VVLCRESLDEAARTAGQCDDAPVFDMHFMDPAQNLAVEGSHFRIP
jgi:hypothetical protein